MLLGRRHRRRHRALDPDRAGLPAARRRPMGALARLDRRTEARAPLPAALRSRRGAGRASSTRERLRDLGGAGPRRRARRSSSVRPSRSWKGDRSRDRRRLHAGGAALAVLRGPRSLLRQEGSGGRTSRYPVTRMRRSVLGVLVAVLVVVLPAAADAAVHTQLVGNFDTPIQVFAPRSVPGSTLYVVEKGGKIIRRQGGGHRNVVLDIHGTSRRRRAGPAVRRHLRPEALRLLHEQGRGQPRRPLHAEQRPGPRAVRLEEDDPPRASAGHEPQRRHLQYRGGHLYLPRRRRRRLRHVHNAQEHELEARQAPPPRLERLEDRRLRPPQSVALVVRPHDRRHLHRRRRAVRPRGGRLPARLEGRPPAENYGWNRYEGDLRGTCANQDAWNNSGQLIFPKYDYGAASARRSSAASSTGARTCRRSAAATSSATRRRMDQDRRRKTLKNRQTLGFTVPNSLVRRELERRALRGFGQRPGLQARRQLVSRFMRVQFVDWPGARASRGRARALPGRPRPGASFLDVETDSRRRGGRGRRTTSAARPGGLCARGRSGRDRGRHARRGLRPGNERRRRAALVAPAPLRARRRRSPARRAGRLARPLRAGEEQIELAEFVCGRARTTSSRPRRSRAPREAGLRRRGRAGGGALSRRGRADRPGGRPHPGRGQHAVLGNSYVLPTPTPRSPSTAARASRQRVTVLELERAGVEAKLYPGSWSEWSSRGLEVERG